MKISTEQLYSLCNKYQWFTNGDTTQYRLLFDERKKGASLERLALIIRICSENYTEEQILKILQEETDL